MYKKNYNSNDENKFVVVQSKQKKNSSPQNKLKLIRSFYPLNKTKKNYKQQKKFGPE